MHDLIELAINFGIFAALFLIGLFAGRRAERKHLKDLEEREAAFKDFFISDLGRVQKPGDTPLSGRVPMLVSGEATIGSDYFKTFISGLKNILGGNVPHFERLQMRARREAVLRMMEEARAGGFNAIANLRYATTDIGGSTKRAKALPVASIIAYGTAYQRAES